ncbi:MAG: OmpH family outer membrane protein [Puniceicoccaceae bacterium]|nr:MAG: OmpH family outer membrane protein [Puniceicoccaceae bacterium]
MKLKSTILLLAAFTVGFGALQAQPALRLITVNLVEAYDSYYKAEEANARLREDMEQAQAQIERMNTEGNTLVEQYREMVEQSENPALSEEARLRAQQDSQNKLEEIQRKQNEIQQFRANTQRSLEQRQRTQRELLLDEINEVVMRLAQDRGATLVLDTSGPSALGVPAVMYADSAYDITTSVVQELNKDRPTD